MWEKVKSILVTIFCFIYFSFALSMTVLLLNFNDYGVTQFGETSIVVLKEKVNFGGFKKGQVVIVESESVSNYQVGDIVFTYRVINKIPHIEVGKVGEVYLNERAIAYENGDTYSEEYIIGKPTKTYNKMGTFLAVIQSKWGFLFIILVPCFLLFIYQIFALVVEIKYGSESTV